MIEPNVFIRNNYLRGLTETKVGGESVLDSYSRVAPRLAEIAGDDVASLFARPAVTRGNGETESSVAWYIAKAGTMRSWGALSREEQARAAIDIGNLLDRMRAHVGDPEIGAQIAGWLSVPSLENDLLIVGDRPYLLNWGTIPSSIAHEPTAVAAHQRATLALFGSPIPVQAARPAAANEAQASAAAPTGSRGFGWGRKAASATAGSPPPAGEAPAPPATTRRRRDWLPVAIAAGVAGLALLISFIPGVLVRDNWTPPVATPLDDSVRRQAMETAERRIQQLQQELSQQVCRPVSPAPGAPAPPNVPGQRGALPSIRPSPASLPAPLNGTLTTPPNSLRDFLVQATALIFSDEPDGIAHGSAFFINERQLVTNRHVVEDAPSGKVRVVTPSTGGTTTGNVIAITAAGDINDFAVIQIQPSGPHPVIPLQAPAEQLQPVIASGFPGFAVSEDDVFKKAMRGDARALPEPILTQGSVTANQTTDSAPVVLHSASILKGNSGGPLVDTCGRLLGVNTYLRQDQEQIASLNYALGSNALRKFLESKGINFTSDAPCPTPAATQPPAATPSPTPPPAGATPAPTPRRL